MISLITGLCTQNQCYVACVVTSPCQEELWGHVLMAGWQMAGSGAAQLGDLKNILIYALNWTAILTTPTAGCNWTNSLPIKLNFYLPIGGGGCSVC